MNNSITNNTNNTNSTFDGISSGRPRRPKLINHNEDSLVPVHEALTNFTHGLHSDFIIRAINDGARGSDHDLIDITTFEKLNTMSFKPREGDKLNKLIVGYPQ